MAATLTDWLRNLRGRLPESETDADLLRRFGTDRDEEAFSALVARHGPMVFGVCRRILGHGPDAEDAFQAVFVILAVKADAVSRIGKVGGWLHGVAFHTARKALSRRFRRRSDSSDLTDLIPARDDHHDPDAEHLREKLDEVIAGLPDRYRAAVVMCELEQLSRADAAGRLGWTEGTLSGRLARARKLLADRLTRRGVLASVATLTAALSARPLSASVPGTLAASAIHVSKLVANGLPLPIGLATLTRGVKSAMILHRLKLTAAGLVAAGLLTAGLGSLWANDAPPTPRPAAQLRATPAADAPGWKLKQTLTHSEGVTAVAFGADLIVSGDDDGNLTLWDATTGKVKEKLIDVAAFEIPNKTAINSLAFNPDSSWLYITNFDNSAIHACQLDPKNRKFPGFGGNGTFRALGFSPDGEYYMHSRGADLSLFKNTFADNVIGGQRDGRLKADSDIKFAAITPNNETVVVATDNHAVAAYGFGFDPKQVWSASGKVAVTGLAISPDSKLAAVATKDGTVRVLDIASGKSAGELKGHKGAANAVAFSPDGKRIATAGEDKSVRVWDVETKQTLAALKGHAEAVTSVAFGPDGTMLVSGSADKTAKVWHLGK
jgi:RNA polymerase sigma factor (sigma-70 family)